MLTGETIAGNGSAILAAGVARQLLSPGIKPEECSSLVRKNMWTALKVPISHLVKQWTYNLTRPGNTAASEKTKVEEAKENQAREGKVKERNFDSARMSHNRLQSLDGFGYRECYMEKLREVASESDPLECNREYWFGKLSAQAAAEKEAFNQGHAESIISGSKIPKIMEAIPNRSVVSSTQLQAYMQSRPKSED